MIREVFCVCCEKQLSNCQIMRLNDNCYICLDCSRNARIMELDKAGYLITRNNPIKETNHD